MTDDSELNVLNKRSNQLRQFALIRAHNLLEYEVIWGI